MTNKKKISYNFFKDNNYAVIQEAISSEVASFCLCIFSK